MPRPYPRPTRNGPGTCDHCHAPVLWTLTTASRREMAVDHPVDPHGNQAVRTDTDGQLWTRQLTRARPRPEWDEALHLPHISTCQNRPPTPRRPTHTPPRTAWRRP